MNIKNLLKGTLCLLMAGAYMNFHILPAVEGIGGAVGMGVFNGLLYPLGFALIQYNIRKNGVVISSVFSGYRSGGS